VLYGRGVATVEVAPRGAVLWRAAPARDSGGRPGHRRRTRQAHQGRPQDRRWRPGRWRRRHGRIAGQGGL